MTKQVAKFLSVPRAIEQATGYRPHPATCWRWYSIGLHGVKLDTWMLGGRRVTTEEAVLQFMVRRKESPTAPNSISSARKALNSELGID